MKVRTLAVLIGACLLLVVTGVTALAQGPQPPPAPQAMTPASYPLTVRTNVGPVDVIDPSLTSHWSHVNMFFLLSVGWVKGGIRLISRCQDV